MRHDEFARHEADARDLIETLGQLSRDHQSSADFEALVLSRADEVPTPRRGLWTWFFEKMNQELELIILQKISLYLEKLLCP